MTLTTETMKLNDVAPPGFTSNPASSRMKCWICAVK